MPKEKIRVKAVVTKIDKDYIYLLPASEKFDSCESCDSMLCDKKNKIRRVKFQAGFNVNDTVYIVADSSSVMKHALMLYGLPVLVIFLLVLLLSKVSQIDDIIVAIVSILSLPITYLLIRRFYKDGCYIISIEKID